MKANFIETVVQQLFLVKKKDTDEKISALQRSMRNIFCECGDYRLANFILECFSMGNLSEHNYVVKISVFSKYQKSIVRFLEERKNNSFIFVLIDKEESSLEKNWLLKRMLLSGGVIILGNPRVY